MTPARDAWYVSDIPADRTGRAIQLVGDADGAFIAK
jgi:hypothetical protein